MAPFTFSSADTLSFILTPTPEDPAEMFDPDQLDLLEKLNRTDRERLPRSDHIVVPDRWDAPEVAYSPLPSHVPRLEDYEQALLVHQPLQVFGAYEGGRLVRWGPVSTGRRDTPTPPGRFNLNWRSRGRHSTVNPEWYLTWYFNFHNERGLSFHQYALPGEPASHACVRLLERDARWIYGWGEEWELDDRGWEILESGTPVWIVGECEFDAPPPWKDPENPHPLLSAEDLKLTAPSAGGGTAGPRSDPEGSTPLP